MKSEKAELDEGFLDELEEVDDDEDSGDDGEGEGDGEEDQGIPDKGDRPIDGGTREEDIRGGGGARSPEPDKEGDDGGVVSIGDWDPDDLEDTIKRFHEVSAIHTDLTKIQKKLEEAIIFALKKRRWDKAVSEDAKVTVRLVAKKKQIIDRDNLIKTCTKSEIEKMLRIVETEHIEVADDTVRERMKKHV